MTNEQVKGDWKKEYSAFYQWNEVQCEDCGSAYAECLSGSGICRCESCADAAIAYGRKHMPEAYDDAQ